jgi:hypothetical protein
MLRRIRHEDFEAPRGAHAARVILGIGHRQCCRADKIGLVLDEYVAAAGRRGGAHATRQ